MCESRRWTLPSSSHSHWQTVYYVVRMTVCFSEAQTSRVFRSAHILLRVNIRRNDDVVTEKKSNNFVVFKGNEMPFGAFS